MDSASQQVRRRTYEWLARVDQRVPFSSLFANHRNVVLMYHSVGDPSRFGNVTQKRFRRDMTYVTDRFSVVDLPDVLSNPSSGPKRVAITFDDGYRTFFRYALPVIEDIEVPVTVFVPVDLIDDGSTFRYRLDHSPDAVENFNDVPPAVEDARPADLMTPAQLERLVAADQVTIGNHTRTHPDLSAISDRQVLEEEIVAARETLESRFGVTVDRFCFPYGRFNRTALEMVRDSHEYAVTTTPRPLGDDPDPHRIPRLTAHEAESTLDWDLTGIRWRLSELLGGPRDDADRGQTASEVG